MYKKILRIKGFKQNALYTFTLHFLPYKKDEIMTRFQDDYKTLKHALNDVYRVQELKGLAKNFSKKFPTRKAELIDYIASTVLADLNSIIAKLSPTAVNALAEAVHNWDGEFKSKAFSAKYGGLPTKSSTRQNQMDLLFAFFINGSIPADLMARLQKIIKPPALEKIHYENLPGKHDLTVRNTAHESCINLHTLLAMVNEKKIRVSPKTGRATAATIKKITSVLYEGDFYEDDSIGPMQAFTWPLLLQGGGLASIDGNLLKLTRKGKTLLNKELAQGIKAIFKKWEKTKIIDEFTRVTAIKGQKAAKGRAMSSPVRRRPVINEAMTCLEPGRWVQVNEVERFMCSENYTFEMENYEWRLYFGDPNYGNLGYYDTWPLLQLRYLLIYFFEYCATLGLLDVAYKHPDYARPDFQSCWGADEYKFLSMCDGLMYIRLNDLGAWVMDIFQEYGTLDSQTFEAHGTDIIHTGKGTLTADHSIYLDKIGNQEEAGKWHISTTSLLLAVQEGDTTKNIKKFIKKIISGKLNNSFIQLFNEVEDRSGQITQKGKVSLLECHSQIRKQILMDSKLSRLCLSAGEHYIVILPGKDQLFAKHLRALGIIVGK